MCSGAPTLTNRAVNIWPEVERFGAVIADDQVDSLAEGLEQALNDLPRLKEQATTNREQVLEWLDPDRLCQEYAAMYGRVIAEAT